MKGHRNLPKKSLKDVNLPDNYKKIKELNWATQLLVILILSVAVCFNKELINWHCYCFYSQVKIMFCNVITLISENLLFYTKFYQYVLW